MRLNQAIQDTGSPIATEAQSVLKNLLDRVTESLSVNLILDNPYTKDICDRFFSQYYVKPDYKGYVNDCNISEKLSTIEADILNFCISGESKTKPYLFIDHAGRGKTTILKYLAYYLYYKEKDIQSKLLPIYISLRAHEREIHELEKTTAVHAFCRQLIKESAFSTAYSFFQEKPYEILTWINDNYPSSLQGMYPPETISKVIKNPKKHIQQLATTNSEDLITLIFGILCFYSKHVRHIVLFLDDADNFTEDIQRAILDFAKQKISRGMGVLVALRFSTWRTLESERRDSESHISRRIYWSNEHLKRFLKIRLDNAKAIVTLTLQSSRADVEHQDIVDAFVDLLRNDHTSDFLIRTSNYNLHSLMRKLSLMANSWHFNDQYLLKEYLTKKAVNPMHGVNLRSTFNLILGSFNGSFQSCDEMASCGIINCFCTGEDKHEPYSFFARIHMLSRLQEHDNENTTIPVKQIREEYVKIFGEYLSFSRVFSRALYRLIQGGMILTTSCRRYQKLRDIEEHIIDDSLYISDCGLHYLHWLIKRMDYLFFMKDDIDWPNNVNLEDITYVTVSISRKKRHRHTLIALKHLMTLELNMLDELLQRLGDPGDAEIAKSYVSLFSAKKIPKSNDELLFTKIMFTEYIDYLKLLPSYSEGQDYIQEFDVEINDIKVLLNDYEDIRRSFNC